MKYLKLFEKFIEEPKFFRFNKFDLLGTSDSLKLFFETITLLVM